MPLQKIPVDQGGKVTVLAVKEMIEIETVITEIGIETVIVEVEIVEIETEIVTAIVEIDEIEETEIGIEIGIVVVVQMIEEGDVTNTTVVEVGEVVKVKVMINIHHHLVIITIIIIIVVGNLLLVLEDLIINGLILLQHKIEKMTLILFRLLVVLTVDRQIIGIYRLLQVL